MRFVDSHVHTSDYALTLELLAATQQSGIVLLSCGVDEASSARTLEISENNPGSALAFVGLHPSETKRASRTDWVPALLTRASGVGEIGLDPKYSEVGVGSLQLRAFREQLAFAESAGKPVQVHTRNAESSCLDELQSHSLPSVLLHWFNGESEMRRAEGKGYFVSFGPALLESRKLQRMALAYSLDLILVESDGPVPFAPLGGAEGPLTVPSVVFKLAELKGVPFEEMAEKTARNAMDYLPDLGKVKPTTESGSDRKFG